MLKVTDAQATQLVGAARVRQAKLRPPGARVARNSPPGTLPPVPDDWCLEFALSWPVSVNALYTTATNGKRVLSTKGRHYARMAQKEMLGHLSAQDRVYLPYPTPVTVTLHAYAHVLTGWDLDNLWKVTLDCLEKAGILRKDELVFSMHGYKHWIDHHATPSITLMLTGWKD